MIAQRRMLRMGKALRRWKAFVWWMEDAFASDVLEVAGERIMWLSAKWSALGPGNLADRTVLRETWGAWKEVTKSARACSFYALYSVSKCSSSTSKKLAVQF